ncbi:MAG TPA: STAS domain-containing protein, partial [Marmoricola sp.]|nr:STAS domain-containing protein [Marmoricola sp.]
MHHDETTLAVTGPLDARTVSAVREELRLATGQEVILDLSECDWIDGHALTMLVAATTRAQREGRRLVLRGCGPRLMRTLHVSRMRARLEVEPAEIA